MRYGVWRDYLTPTGLRQAVNVIRIFGIGYVYRVREGRHVSILVSEAEGDHGELLGVFSGLTPRRELWRMLREEMA